MCGCLVDCVQRGELSWNVGFEGSFVKKLVTKSCSRTEVIDKSLRLANVLPWVFRVAMQDVEIKGFVIPKGWKVLVFLMGKHLDATIYNDPGTFNPWRWQVLV